MINDKLEIIKKRILEEKNGAAKEISRHPFPISNLQTGKVAVEVSPNYYRPTEVDYLIGDARKAKEKLGWEAKVRFEELVKVMVEADVEKVIRKGY